VPAGADRRINAILAMAHENVVTASQMGRARSRVWNGSCIRPTASAAVPHPMLQMYECKRSLPLRCLHNLKRIHCSCGPASRTHCYPTKGFEGSQGICGFGSGPKA
jgi:hypothetical protein